VGEDDERKGNREAARYAWVGLAPFSPRGDLFLLARRQIEQRTHARNALSWIAPEHVPTHSHLLVLNEGAQGVLEIAQTGCQLLIMLPVCTCAFFLAMWVTFTVAPVISSIREFPPGRAP
jgi:hypothetical protein